MFVIDCTYRLKEIVTDMVDRYKIDILYTQVWHVKTWALNALKGSPDDSFMLLSEHCHNLVLCNTNTLIYIVIDEGNWFKFFSWHWCI